MNNLLLTIFVLGTRKVISSEQPSTHTTLLLQAGKLMHNVISTHAHFMRCFMPFLCLSVSLF